MASYNRVALMGNLTRDPELRYTPQGTPVGQFGLALNRKRGEGEEHTFVEIRVWKKQAEVCQQYLSKGRLVFLEGRIQQDRWEDKDGGGNRSRIVIVAERVQFLPNGNGKAHAEPADTGTTKGEEEEVPF